MISSNLFLLCLLLLTVFVGGDEHNHIVSSFSCGVLTGLITLIDYWHSVLV